MRLLILAALSFAAVFGRPVAASQIEAIAPLMGMMCPGNVAGTSGVPWHIFFQPVAVDGRLYVQEWTALQQGKDESLEPGPKHAHVGTLPVTLGEDGALHFMTPKRTRYTVSVNGMNLVGSAVDVDGWPYKGLIFNCHTTTTVAPSGG
jgi:hypothetical protein